MSGIPVGFQFLDSFRAVEHLGGGSYGDVYLAERGEGKGKETRAVKVFKDTSKSEMAFISREVEMIKKLKFHRNIAEFKAYDPYRRELHMAYYRSDVFQMWRECIRNGWDMSWLNTMTEQVLQGLKYLHETIHVVHGDIKGDNILCSHPEKADHFVVGDFGCVGPERTGCVGTDLYMAPEVRIYNKIRTKSDVWSLGLVILELTGNAPENAGKLCEDGSEWYATIEDRRKKCDSWLQSMLEPDRVKRCNATKAIVKFDQFLSNSHSPQQQKQQQQQQRTRPPPLSSTDYSRTYHGTGRPQLLTPNYSYQETLPPHLPPPLPRETGSITRYQETREPLTSSCSTNKRGREFPPPDNLPGRLMSTQGGRGTQPSQDMRPEILEIAPRGQGNRLHPSTSYSTVTYQDRDPTPSNNLPHRGLMSTQGDRGTRHLEDCQPTLVEIAPRSQNLGFTQSAADIARTTVYNFQKQVLEDQVPQYQSRKGHHTRSQVTSTYIRRATKAR